MNERPILVFPSPQEADRTRRPFGSGAPQKPDIQRQAERLSPMFQRLQDAFEAKRVDALQNPSGTEPEETLVIEIVGNSIPGFFNAIRKVEGLEWMGEMEVDDIVPDGDFYHEDQHEKELNGHLYFIMSDQRALDEIISLWNRYSKNPSMKFERGLEKFKSLFRFAKDIRRWDVKDRLGNTGALDIWRDQIEHDGEGLIKFEMELWFRGDNSTRKRAENNIRFFVDQAGGRVIGQSVIEEIAYHGMLAEIPAKAMHDIIDLEEIELVRCEEIMFFQAVGQMAIGYPSSEEIDESGEDRVLPLSDSPMPEGDPVIAILDGLPLANHRLLADRLNIDDIYNREGNYQANQRKHGTVIASLIIHGDRNNTESPLSRPVFILPIMKPDTRSSDMRESVPDDHLIVDLFHIAVKKMLDNERGEGSAPYVKVINLSICDINRPFNRFMSPLAKLLDWLSAKYSVLFIVSAGNHTKDIALGMSWKEFEAMDNRQKEDRIVKSIMDDIRNRKILSPAETINGLSIGSLHYDNCQDYYEGNRFDPFENLLPSPISSFGGGYRRSIKPDIIFPGGKQLYIRPAKLSEESIEISQYTRSPGNKSACPGANSGSTTEESFSCGTSNATALISRAAGVCHESLTKIFDDNQLDDMRIYEAPLLKTMLVHGSSLGEAGDNLLRVLQSIHAPRPSDFTFGSTKPPGRKGRNRDSKKFIRQWMGYGIPDIDRVLNCTEQRATLLGFGQLKDGEAHIFSLPLPHPIDLLLEKSLRFTITLAWLSPIASKTQRYRRAGLWFELHGDHKNSFKRCSMSADDWQAARRGTVQHEIFEGSNKPTSFDNDNIEIKVNCRKDAGEIIHPVAYGLAVSIEVKDGIDIQVYDEIRERIAQRPALGIEI